MPGSQPPDQTHQEEKTLGLCIDGTFVHPLNYTQLWRNQFLTELSLRLAADVFFIFLPRFAQNVFAARVAEPQNRESPGMPSGRMTFPCVMTVPNCLLKVSDTLLACSGVMLPMPQGNMVSTVRVHIYIHCNKLFITYKF